MAQVLFEHEAVFGRCHRREGRAASPVLAAVLAETEGRALDEATVATPKDVLHAAKARLAAARELLKAHPEAIEELELVLERVEACQGPQAQRGLLALAMRRWWHPQLTRKAPFATRSRWSTGGLPRPVTRGRCKGHVLNKASPRALPFGPPMLHNLLHKSVWQSPLSR